MSTLANPRERVAIPRSRENDYTPEMARLRRDFVREQTGADLSHVSNFSFDPAILPGNIENFTGVAQVPIGIAGPLRVNGEFAKGDFYIPLATTEGTLVSSYNRGMRLLMECGGVKATVVDDAMQRAPCFSFKDARQARDFGVWVEKHIEEIREQAEVTTRVGKLRNIEQYPIGPVRYLRFNFTTGDAAGQNMAGKATHAACEWIKRVYPVPLHYVLTGNIDTDKKHSQMNVMHTRGKRVIAEVVLRRELIREVLHIDSSDLVRAVDVQMAGAVLAGSSSTAAHAANGLAAMFIATGQDVANIAESHTAQTFVQGLDNGDFYWSITLPSLIVATYGGGTGLATQKQCLEMLGCCGEGKVKKLAEICAGVVLAGEVSLVGAILHGDWVTAHERLGRNRG